MCSRNCCWSKRRDASRDLSDGAQSSGLRHILSGRRRRDREEKEGQGGEGGTGWRREEKEGQGGEGGTGRRRRDREEKEERRTMKRMYYCSGEVDAHRMNSANIKNESR